MCIRDRPAAARIFVGKDNVGSNRWFVEFLDTSQMRTDCGDGTDNVTTTIASPTLNSWYVGALVLERATNKMRCGWCPFGGPPTVSSEIDASLVGDITGAGNLVFGSSFGIDGCENMDTAFLAIGVGASYATGMSANLSTALSNFAATFAATQTGTYAATGVWASGAPLAADTDPKQAPKGDDGVATIGPTGKVYGLVGNFYRRHRNLRFQYVAKNRVWSADATYGEDYETWYLETQRGQHSWFSAFSPINVYWDNAGTATLLGNGVVTAGWKMPKPATLDEIELPVKGWTGLVNVNLGDLYACLLYTSDAADERSSVDLGGR